MRCPECGGEYREGVEVCADCAVALVPGPAAEAVGRPGPEEDLVSVLETGDPAALPAILSVLDASGIPYVVQGEEAFGLLPLGPLGGRLSPRGLGVAVLVPRARADEAAGLLAGGSGPAPEEEAGPADPTEAAQGRA